MAVSNAQLVPQDKNLSCYIQGEGGHISDHDLHPSPAPRDTLTYVNKLLHKRIHRASSLSLTSSLSASLALDTP